MTESIAVQGYKMKEKHNYAGKENEENAQV